jgi:hypothetical protein
MNYKHSTKTEGAYQVIKIDSLENIYIIHAIKADSIYKILSHKEYSLNCKEIKLNEYYILDLKSLFMRGFNGKYDITPRAIDNLNGVQYFGTDIFIDNDIKNEVRDIFVASNLKGLCLWELKN